MNLGKPFLRFALQCLKIYIANVTKKKKKLLMRILKEGDSLYVLYFAIIKCYDICKQSNSLNSCYIIIMK